MDDNKKCMDEDDRACEQRKVCGIYYDDCVFLALDTLSTASLIGLRPFRTVICALKYGAGNSICMSSDAVGPPSPTLSPSVEGK